MEFQVRIVKIAGEIYRRFLDDENEEEEEETSPKKESKF